MLSSFLKIKVFCLLFKKATHSAKLREKTTWSYKLGDPDMLFHLHERHSYLAEMEHEQRKKQREHNYQAHGKLLSSKSLWDQEVLRQILSTLTPGRSPLTQAQLRVWAGKRTNTYQFAEISFVMAFILNQCKEEVGHLGSSYNSFLLGRNLMICHCFSVTEMDGRGRCATVHKWCCDSSLLWIVMPCLEPVSLKAAKGRPQSKTVCEEPPGCCDI